MTYYCPLCQKPLTHLHGMIYECRNESCHAMEVKVFPESYQIMKHESIFVLNPHSRKEREECLFGKPDLHQEDVLYGNLI
jgi:hypothetical protein